MKQVDKKKYEMRTQWKCTQTKLEIHTEPNSHIYTQSKLTKRSNDNQWEEMNLCEEKHELLLKRKETYTLKERERNEKKSGSTFFNMPLNHSLSRFSILISLFFSFIASCDGIHSRNSTRYKSAFLWQAHNYLCCVSHRMICRVHPIESNATIHKS